MINKSMIILFVKDADRAKEFYSSLFRKLPELDVEGMTEFVISDQLTLGLMPIINIRKVLENQNFDNIEKNVVRHELYLYVDDLDYEFENAIKSGAELISPIQRRNWGDRACYFADPEANIFAFADKN